MKSGGISTSMSFFISKIREDIKKGIQNTLIKEILIWKVLN